MKSECQRHVSSIHTSLTMLLLTCLMTSLLLNRCQGHVALNYPPARNLPLDFLDNARTTPPCGQARGSGPVTDLKEGSNVTVTWYLGYAHDGGFLLEILTYDVNGKHNISYTLTGPAHTYVGGANVTTESYNVSLPESFTCQNCTIRLVRQALNWGPYYIFWSCADVNIVSNYVEKCSGVGQLLSNGSCSCPTTYSGSVCQYKDECATDVDCGGQGRCLFITPYSYPRYQCYCLPGWFGLKCEHSSPLTSVQFSQSVYTTQSLSSNLNISYRIIQTGAVNELEVVLQGGTMSFIGLGWKSRNQVCKTSAGGPVPEENPEPASATPEGSSVPEGSPVPEGSAVPEGSPEPNAPKAGIISTVPEGNPEPVGIPEGTPEGSAEPEPGTSTALNGMDCTDMMIGSAVGNLYRIRDYYSRDRSTPRLDDFYGGTQSLTAAVGQQSPDGVTTIIWRRPVKALEKEDHDIENSIMTVIWSYGQAPPLGNSKVGDFYRQDELKYHSFNRGIANINFYGSAASSSPVPVTGYSYPAGCSGDACTYSATWSLNVATDSISFSVRAKQPPTTWTAIGFAPEPTMANVDVVYGFLDSLNQPVVRDAWIGIRYSPPANDVRQDVRSSSITYNNGFLTLTFERPRISNDPHDWSFTDNSCYYFLYPTGGGTHSDVAINQHLATPLVSSAKICINAASSITKSPSSTAAAKRTGPGRGGALNGGRSDHHCHGVMVVTALSLSLLMINNVMKNKVKI